MSSALFGILQLDRGEPLGYANVSGLVQAWLQDAGGFAAVGLVAYLIYALATPTDKSESERIRVPVSTWMVAMAALAFLCYAPIVGLLATEWLTGKTWTSIAGIPIDPPTAPPPPAGSPVKIEPPVWHWQLRPMLLMVGGLFALLGIGEPFVRDALKLRWRRVWALAKLGFKEAVHSKLLWVGLLVLLPYMFRGVWMSHTRPADELRSLAAVGVWWVTILVLFTALVLSSFSIPNDIKNLTIQTVVTKPVERFEVVLGRFFGYAALMTLGLALLTGASLVFINTANLSEQAEAETAKARVPLRGKLEFKSRRGDFEGTNVGREFDYRRYIVGHPDSPQRAVWHFATVPAALASAEGDRVPVEFTFDIFRMTKGEENRGVDTSFRFVTWQCPQRPPTPSEGGVWQWEDAARQREYEREVADLRERGLNPDTARPGTPAWEAVNRLAEKYGFYEIRGKEVFDYTVMGVEVPAGLFRNAREGDPPGGGRPRLSVYVKCESGGQYLGMAEPDLYILEANRRFTQNFVKGMVGVWCRLCIVIGLAVACSTYLSGVLSLLVAALIFGLGYFTDHMNDLAFNRNVGGGPFESMSRLVRAEQPTIPLPETAGSRVVQTFDQFWAWVVRRIQNMVPDVESFTWTHFVSEGFNISTEYLVLNILVMVGYLLPWGILAYYLMKSREIAS